MSNILLNHFYCLKIMYTSLPFFIYFYFLLFFLFFAPRAAFLPSRYEPIYLLTIRHLKCFLGAIVYHRTISLSDMSTEDRGGETRRGTSLIVPILRTPIIIQ